jgi:hypothetical protein
MIFSPCIVTRHGLDIGHENGQTPKRKKSAMTMQAATEAFTAATTADGIRAAYDAMLEWSDATEGAEADDVDAMLERMGLPSLTQQLTAAAK